MKNISSCSCNFLTIDPLSGLAAVLKVSLGLKLMGGFWRLSSQKTIESSNRSWLEASYRLRTFPWRHYFIPLFSFQGTILCTSSCKCTLHPKQGLNHFSVPWVYGRVSGQQMPPVPRWSGWQSYHTGIGTGRSPVSNADHASMAALAPSQPFRSYHCS